jgi:peptide/nickel transport system substrate-binding protein
VRLVPRSWEELVARVEAGQVALYYAALVTETADASDVLDSMAHSRQPERGWGADNLSGYANPELDALIEESGVAMEPLARRQNLQRCLRILARDLPFIPLLVPHEIYGARRDLVWEPRLDGNVLAQEMRRR